MIKKINQLVEKNINSRNPIWRILRLIKYFINKIMLTRSLQAIFEAHFLGGYIIGGDPETWYPELWDWVINELEIKSVIDIGCGEGHSTKYFKEKGCNVLGIEGSKIAIKNSPIKESLIRHDYTKGPFHSDNEYDLAWSCEFVEHVEEKYLNNYLETFKVSKYIFMTHALSGQGGYHHVNCKPKEYWIEKISEIGFKFDKELTQKAREKALHGYFEKTGLVFKKCVRVH